MVASFAVIPQYKQVWEALSGLVQGSYVEILEDDGANIVDLIEER